MSVGNELIAIRDTQVGPNISVFYKHLGGLVAVKGEGCYLIDTEGNRHLDTCNNVACVGHSHPAVVNAGQKALGEIQTNQRFLHPGQQEYLTKLLKLFPAELNTVYLVNSGSEANDLALRMAREFSTAVKSGDTIVLDHAYHGHTTALINLSPYKWAQCKSSHRGKYKTPNVHVVSMPLTSAYPPMDRDIPICTIHTNTLSNWRKLPFTAESGRAYAKEVEDVVNRTGGVGVFIAESAMGCGGQVLLPPEYLSTCYAAVRAKGGVCIADEVQTGFARSGTHMWMFERHGVVPDIVTLGKPMGNGYPLSAVVCRREIAEAFAASGMEYFNTFGGNSVACAIGKAVLDTIESESLLQHAGRVGEYLTARLQELRHRWPSLVGDIRGCGLFQGIEFIRCVPCSHCLEMSSIDNAASHMDENSSCAVLVPVPHVIVEDETLTQFIVDYLQQCGVVASRDANVIKFKPPLVISILDVDVFLLNLEEGIKLWHYSDHIY